MVKPDVQITDFGLTTVAAIKEAAGLEPADWKSFFVRVQQFISENEDATSKVPRAWKKQEWKDLAEAFMDEEDNGKTYFHHSRGNTNDEDYLFWPEDREVVTYIGFSIIKFEAAKYHSKKRKADGDKSTPTPKKAKTAKLAAEASDDKAEDGEEENEEGDGEGDNDNSDKITVKSAKSTKKAAPKKADSTDDSKKAVSTFKSPVTPASKAAAKKQEVKKAETPKIDETSGDESEDDIPATPSVKRKAPAPPPEPVVTNMPAAGLAFSGITLGNSSKNGPMHAAKEPTPKTEDEDDSAGDHQQNYQSMFNNASFIPAVAGAQIGETETQQVLSSIETDHDAMSKYINLPEDSPPKDLIEDTEHVDDDASKNQVNEAADTPLLSNSAQHDHYPGNANKELTGLGQYPGNAHKETRVDTPLHHRSPGPEPGSLLHHQAHLQSPTQTPSVGAHVHLPTTISLSLTFLSGTDNATSHLMVVPTSATLAEVLGRYVVQLPQGDVGHQALADAASCAVKGADGKIQKFGFREAGVERLWRAAIGRSVRSAKTGTADEDVVEVELS